MISSIIKIIRPQQWSKNLFIFLPLFFGGSMMDTKAIIMALIAFFAYSFAASSIYCINDIKDVEADRRHPVKCHRPIASGKISISYAYGLMLLMALLAVICIVSMILYGHKAIDLSAFTLKTEPHQYNALAAGAVVCAYYILNIFYCLRLKSYAIIDVTIIALGFVLRILVGGFATGVIISHWLVMMTFLLTLLLSLAKRRDDVLKMNRTGEAPRHNTSRYNLEFINQAITITATGTLVCYIMYTISPEVVARTHFNYVYLTTIFVILGLLRYLQRTVVDEQSGDPTRIFLHDRFLQLVVLMWMLSFLFIIYII